jgi:uncharacterized sporulation protein YeaH/YhbH (DUF444 family)
MNPFTILVRLPLLPVDGVISLGRVIQEQVEREYHNPASVRRQLEEAEAEAASGAVSDAEEARAQQQALKRVIDVEPTRRRESRDPAGRNRR